MACEEDGLRSTSRGTSSAISVTPNPKAGGGRLVSPFLIWKPPEHFDDDRET